MGFPPSGKHNVIIWAVLSSIAGCLLVEGSGRCSIFGRYHVNTFDGVVYGFPGDCSYLLAGDCHRRTFTILGEFSRGQRKGVTLFLGEFFELHLSVDGTLSQGAKRLALPYASSSVFVAWEFGSVRMWSEEFGFSLRIDQSHNIELSLSKHHGNRTCGLCGNYNSLPEDDYSTQEGFVADNVFDFGNSWALNGAVEPCRRVAPPPESCNVTGETSRELMARCEMLRSGAVFRRCAALVDPAVFVALCEADVCHCGVGEECLCQALLEYTRACASRGVQLPGWSAASLCSPRCPRGMQYRECTQTCSMSCQSLNIQEVCKDECVDGCSCPVGKVLDGDQCVEVSECSCLHSGRRYPAGATISQDCNTCVCRHGSWECTNEACPGECVVNGRGHYKTFDDKPFTFSGACQYLLAQDQLQQFTAVIETAQCADGQDAICTRSVMLKFHGLINQTVWLKHGGVVSMEGMNVQTPLINGALRIQRTVLSSVRLSYGEDFQVDWDGRSRVQLKLSPMFSGRTFGMCGNYNGNQGDDFLTAGGVVESAAEGFGNSWKMNAECDDIQTQYNDPCTLNPKRVRYAEEACAVLQAERFSPCHHMVNPAPYVRSCRYDACVCADGNACVCDVLSSYATACAARGVIMNWREPGFCELQCPGSLVYEVCGSVCNQTCRSLSMPDVDCVGVCEEGCFCPRGLFLSEGGECVSADDCACYHQGEMYQPNDMLADHHSICYCERGAMRCSAADGPGTLLSDLFFDEPRSPSRDRRSLSCPAPQQKVVCESVSDVGMECARTCQNLQLECVSQGCVSGCVCPPGTVRHRGQCIPPKQCPCYHNNRPYAPGQSKTMDCNTCVCTGQKWSCTQRLCDGVCQTVGESHYITFDGMKFTFPGRCQYILAQDYCNDMAGTFRVLVENSACGLVGRRCSKTISVFYKGGLITMDHGEVRMQRPVMRDVAVEIVPSGAYYTVLLGESISLIWDKGTRLTLRLSANLRGRVCGLCGNFDGSPNNDLMSSNNQLEVEPVDFGNSWKVRPSCPDASQETSECGTDLVKLVTVEQSCRVLSGDLFKECNSVVDPEPYWEICTHDACACASVGDCGCFCDAVAAYAHACSQRGLVVRWRSNALCPLSCEDLNVQQDLQCQWRFNACGSACPHTCQHPNIQHCPQHCMEGCHAYCPEGQLLDEVTQRCVLPEHCQVCVHDGERVSHGKQIILSPHDPHLCQVCHCENNTLSCGSCPLSGPTPTTILTTPTPLPFSTAMPEGGCDRAMDLAFLVDGSTSLSEEDFEEVKLFIVGVVERFRMGSAHTRASLLLFHSGVKSFGLQVQKRLFVSTVRGMHYNGADVAFMDEGLKYLSVYIYDKNAREHAGRVAVLLTASSNPRPLRATQRLLKKKDITVLTVALGPDVSPAQVNDITKATPSSRSYVLGSVAELPARLLDVGDYLCTLGLDPQVPTRPAPTPRPTASKPFVPPATPESAQVVTVMPTQPRPVRDITFLVEGSDESGEENFNRTRDALVEVMTSVSQEEEELRVTVMQYSLDVTVEINRMELRRREQLLRQIRQLRWGGGAKTNTGHAIRTYYETVRPNQSPDQMVFLITQSPPTDVIQRLPSSKHVTVFPVGIGGRVREVELRPLGRPIMLQNPEQLRELRPLITNLSRTHTLHPQGTLPPTVPCSKPMDVLFLLRSRSAEQFEDMKTFVSKFIKSSPIGRNNTQVAVMVYGQEMEGFTWKEEQTEPNLLHLLDSLRNNRDSKARLGAVLQLAVQNAISPTKGGRMGVAKAVVMLVIDRSADSVQKAAGEAVSAGVSVFPIGVGGQYKREELSALSGAHREDNVLQLSSTVDLLAMVTLGHSFSEKLCRAGPPGMCVDDDGVERKPGDRWLMADGCHSVLCNPSGTMSVESHRLNCDRLEPPTCTHNLPPVKITQPCGCTWACPCMCIGSSTNHVVSFGGVALKLKGACSYLLLRSEGAELVLQTTLCEGAANQICMSAVVLREGGVSVELRNDMKVTVNGVVTSVPFKVGGVSVTVIGALLHQLKSEQHGFTLTFTPHSNEFTVTMDNPTATNTTGICGSCADHRSGLVQSNGLPTSDLDVFLRSWALEGAGGVECAWLPDEVCPSGVKEACAVLNSSVFGACRPLVPVAEYLQMCERVACHPAAVCDLLSAYSSLCRQHGVCVRWRSPSLCPMSCPSTMVYDACRTGCMEQCGQRQVYPGDVTDAVATGNNSPCWATPTEGCFCPEGEVLRGEECVSKENCRQCIDQHGNAYQYLETWTPDENPCVICLCVDQQQINCTAVPCANTAAPVCGPCEILQEKKNSMCCPEFECVCDSVSCELSEPEPCENGLSLILTNPGECVPAYQCVCRKEKCSLKPKLSCPAHKRLTVKQTECCDLFECVCECQNSTQACPPGFITTETTNDCDCRSITCVPDKVCVVSEVVYPVNSEWKDGCKACRCTKHTHTKTGLHIAQCYEPICNQICPAGSVYVQAEGACCGQCRMTSCEEEGGGLRKVGERWQAATDKCVIRECVQVKEEVFITQSNISCLPLATPTCPLGTELRCNTVEDCCPSCHCAMLNACVLNHTVIGAGDSVMVDVCTQCECTVDQEESHLSCRRLSCISCSEGYTLEPVEGACCGRCVASSCIIKRPDGKIITIAANTTRDDGCTHYSCGVNSNGELVLETRITSCPPLDRELCLQRGGQISQIADSCCEMCTEPECRKAVGLMNYIRVDDCQSEEQITLNYCEGRCRSKSVFSLEKNRVERECVCCSATGSESLSVSLRCANGTHTPHSVLTATGCQCTTYACP